MTTLTLQVRQANVSLDRHFCFGWAPLDQEDEFGSGHAVDVHVFEADYSGFCRSVGGYISV